MQAHATNGKYFSKVIADECSNSWSISLFPKLSLCQVKLIFSSIPFDCLFVSHFHLIHNCAVFSSIHYSESNQWREVKETPIFNLMIWCGIGRILTTDDCRQTKRTNGERKQNKTKTNDEKVSSLHSTVCVSFTFSTGKTN